MSSSPAAAPPRGLLVSTEGISGVGKTYLANQVAAEFAAADPDAAPLIVEEFSRRTHQGHDLGRGILRALIDASDQDRFLQGGRPASETLLLLAIKTHDYEQVRDALRDDRLVLEGRSLHTVAVYQSLILHPDDDAAAHDQARQILALAASWRPLPDLTILITDDVGAAVRRAEQRDNIPYTQRQWRLHHRAAALFDRLAIDDPDHIRVLDRRAGDAAHAVAVLRGWIAARRAAGTIRVEPISPTMGSFAASTSDGPR